MILQIVIIATLHQCWKIWPKLMLLFHLKIKNKNFSWFEKVGCRVQRESGGQQTTPRKHSGQMTKQT